MDYLDVSLSYIICALLSSLIYLLNPSLLTFSTVLSIFILLGVLSWYHKVWDEGDKWEWSIYCSLLVLLSIGVASIGEIWEVLPSEVSASILLFSFLFWVFAIAPWIPHSDTVQEPEDGQSPTPDIEEKIKEEVEKNYQEISETVKRADEKLREVQSEKRSVQREKKEAKQKREKARREKKEAKRAKRIANEKLKEAKAKNNESAVFKYKKRLEDAERLLQEKEKKAQKRKRKLKNISSRLKDKNNKVDEIQNELSKYEVNISSSNFCFLEEHNPDLVKIAAEAEMFCQSDSPRQAVMNMRLFGEMITQEIVIRTGVNCKESQYDRLQHLERKNLIPKNIADLLHKIRKAGNTAVHPNEGNTSKEIKISKALRCIKHAWEVAVWFHESFSTTIKNFTPPPFDLAM